MCILCVHPYLSFGQRVDRLVNLAHIEGFCAFSQYVVNDIEHTKNKQSQKCKLTLVPIIEEVISASAGLPLVIC